MAMVREDERFGTTRAPSVKMARVATVAEREEEGIIIAKLPARLLIFPGTNRSFAVSTRM